MEGFGIDKNRKNRNDPPGMSNHHTPVFTRRKLEEDRRNEVFLRFPCQPTEDGRVAFRPRGHLLRAKQVNRRVGSLGLSRNHFFGGGIGDEFSGGCGFEGFRGGLFGGYGFREFRGGLFGGYGFREFQDGLFGSRGFRESRGGLFCGCGYRGFRC